MFLSIRRYLTGLVPAAFPRVLWPLLCCWSLPGYCASADLRVLLLRANFAPIAAEARAERGLGT